jgi:phage shock protein PspC (stress-responsive transcriptional regulator)
MEDKKILGVCLWMAKKLNMDASLVRVLWVLAAVFFGAGILAYLIIFLLLETKVIE